MIINLEEPKSLKEFPGTVTYTHDAFHLTCSRSPNVPLHIVQRHKNLYLHLEEGVSLDCIIEGQAITTITLAKKSTLNFSCLGDKSKSEVFIKEEGCCQFFQVAKNSHLDLSVHLEEKGASVNISGLYPLLNQHSSVFVQVFHKASQTSSSQLIKSLLDGESTFDFTSHVTIDPTAEDASVLQRNKNLLLSDRSTVRSKPLLSILNEKAKKASHGVTTGPLDPEHIFYLTSHGCSETQAKELLTQAFCQEIEDILPPSLGVIHA